MKKRLTFKQLLFEQQVLGILLFTLLVVFLWVVSSIYFSYSASTLTTEDEADVLALDPTIDEKPLLILNSRKWWTPEELQNFTVSAVVKDGNGKIISTAKTITASSSATPFTRTASGSAVIATPTASGSAVQQ